MGTVIPPLSAIWPTALAFVVLFVVLWKFAFPPIVRMLEQRTETIRESLEKAENTKVEAERLLDGYKEQMAEARNESVKIIEQGRKVAEGIKDDIVAKANEEATQIVAKAREAMEAEKMAAIADLQTQVAELSVAVAGKLIGEQLSAADHARLIEKYVAEVGSLNDN